jgi:hypothetical protein
MNTATLVGLIAGIGVPALIAIGTGLLAKFAPSQKCADWLWGVVYPLLVTADKFMSVKIGDKTEEKLRESVLGTIAYVMQVVGQRLDNWIHTKDTDGSEK